MAGACRHPCDGSKSTPQKPSQKRSALKQKAVQNAYEMQRQKQMEENRVRMTKGLEQKFANGGLNLADFSDVACTFVYGAGQTGIQGNKNNTEPQSKDLQADPADEPHAEDLSNTDAKIATEEEELLVAKRSSQALDVSATQAQKKRAKTIVPASSIETRSRATPIAPELGESDWTTDAEGGNSPGCSIPTNHHMTSDASNSPDDQQIVNFQQSDALVRSGQKKRSGRRPTMGHGLYEWTRRNGGNKMKIGFTEGVKRPTNPLHATKLSSMFGVHIRECMPFATHWKLYDSEDTLKHVVPHAIKKVAEKFDMDRSAEVAKAVCTDMIQSGVRQLQYRLKKAYWPKIKNLTPEQAYLMKLDKVEKQSWTQLVDRWFDEDYQEWCRKNVANRECVKQNHTTRSRSYVAHYEHVKTQNNMEETSPIEFYRISHTNKDGVMTDNAQAAYDAMLLKKMGPHPEDYAHKTDVQIVEQVLMEQASSSSTKTTFFSKLGYPSSSQKYIISKDRIRELEERLANQQQQSLQEAEKCQIDLEARIQAQEQKYEEMRRQQDEELAALKKSQEEKTLAHEKRQQEMDALLSLLLRTSQQPSQGN